MLLILLLVGEVILHWDSFKSCYMAIQYWALGEYVVIFFYLLITTSDEELILTPLSLLIFIFLKLQVTLYGAIIMFNNANHTP